jgi:hypothetical protein
VLGTEISVSIRSNKRRKYISLHVNPGVHLVLWTFSLCSVTKTKLFVQCNQIFWNRPWIVFQILFKVPVSLILKHLHSHSLATC